MGAKKSFRVMLIALSFVLVFMSGCGLQERITGSSNGESGQVQDLGADTSNAEGTGEGDVVASDSAEMDSSESEPLIADAPNTTDESAAYPEGEPVVTEGEAGAEEVVSEDAAGDAAYPVEGSEGAMVEGEAGAESAAVDAAGESAEGASEESMTEEGAEAAAEEGGEATEAVVEEGAEAAAEEGSGSAEAAAETATEEGGEAAEAATEEGAEAATEESGEATEAAAEEGAEAAAEESSEATTEEGSGSAEAAAETATEEGAEATTEEGSGSAEAAAEESSEAATEESGEATEAAAEEGAEAATEEGSESADNGSSEAPAATVYTVRAGDSLSQIAENAGLQLATLMRVNNITNPNQIKVGDELLIPASNADGANIEQAYVVQWGDTLGTIAQSFGVSMDALQSANGITNPNRIEIGQTLIIPTP
ncbi:MAG: LysM peptidoglycan-binding domain-containing protein [Candidatus Promineifilaceae bacterium]